MNEKDYNSMNKAEASDLYNQAKVSVSLGILTML
jgi:hypothetical protein